MPEFTYARLDSILKTYRGEDLSSEYRDELIIELERYFTKASNSHNKYHQPIKDALNYLEDKKLSETPQPKPKIMDWLIRPTIQNLVFLFIGFLLSKVSAYLLDIFYK